MAQVYFGAVHFDTPVNLIFVYHQAATVQHAFHIYIFCHSYCFLERDFTITMLSCNSLF